MFRLQRLLKNYDIIEKSLIGNTNMRKLYSFM